jgi:hypothetical protein
MKASLVLPLLFLEIAGRTSVVMAQSTGTFAATGSMTTARAGHTATLLANGKVLVAGGYQRNLPGILASAELYNPSTGTFVPTGAMTAPRTHHTATLLPDGRVLLAGGAGFNLSAELYDPSTGTFTATGNMIQPQSAATLLGNGKVLIVGGSSTPELYDPATGTFTETVAYAGSDASLVWVDTATLLPDGKALITGCECRFNRPLSALYDPSTETFSLTGTMSGPVNWWWQDANTATLLMNGKVLIVGNVENDGFPGVAEMYDRSTDIFSNIGNTTGPHESSTATLLPDGKVLIAGGQLPGGNGASGVDLYSPGTGMFSAAPGMVTNRHNHTATLLPDGTVLIAGGFSNWPEATASAELYYPAALVRAPVLLSLSGDGSGQGAIQHAGTYRIASDSDPAAAGEYLSIYLTGLADGSMIPPQVTIGGRLTEIAFFGDVPGYTDLNVVNVRMPSGVAPGPSVPVRLTYLSRPSNAVTIGVQ